MSAYWGRYYDPIRNDMTNFAGTLTGSILEEQVYALGEYVTYRTRGGPSVQDAFFSPETKTPYTDELQLGYAVDLGYGMSFDALYFNRRSRDIFEDDLHLYGDPTGYASISGVVGDPNAPDSLFLGYDYFGYTENPGSNFVLGTQPGLIRHLVKGGGSYSLPFGLQLGATASWNSGTVASRTFRTSGRNLPLRVPTAEAYLFGGCVDRWLVADSVGSLKNPSWGQIDLRAQYVKSFGRAAAEVFVDMFNILDNQDAVRNQDLVAGQGGVAFGNGLTFVQPRRAFLGLRLRF